VLIGERKSTSDGCQRHPVESALSMVGWFVAGDSLDRWNLAVRLRRSSWSCMQTDFDHETSNVVEGSIGLTMSEGFDAERASTNRRLTIEGFAEELECLHHACKRTPWPAAV
jgi:hypothetical protein